MSTKAPNSDQPALPTLTEVRYSLPALLLELKAEKAAGTISMERLDQHEIGKLFKTKAIRRGKPKQ